MKKISLSLFFILFICIKIYAQQFQNPEYIKVTNERATKIVSKLKLATVEKETAVTTIIAQQFRDLSKIQDERDAEIAKVKTSTISNEDQKIKTEKLKAEADQLISKLHISYLAKLGTQLNEDQIIGVKDGMTYGVLPITYAGYQDMLPKLTEEQKSYIYNNLVEARELAIDGGSSKEKHAWFGKYKGRINNYLSAQGYDLNKESADWHDRVAARDKEKSKK
jgi:hypothetical protein